MPEKNIVRPFPHWVIGVFSAALFIQILHWDMSFENTLSHLKLIPHVSQLPLLVHDSIYPLTGFEGMHLAFNSILLASLIAVFVGIGTLRDQTLWSRERGLVLILGAAVIFQMWHEFEHVVKFFEHIYTGCEMCNGILGSIWNRGYVHATYNTIGLLIPLYVYVRYGFLKQGLQSCMKRIARHPLAAAFYIIVLFVLISVVLITHPTTMTTIPMNE